MPLSSRAAISFFDNLSKKEVTGEGGLLSGENPAVFSTSDPLSIIIVTCQLLYLCIRPFRQPRVIAEVLCGVILGPTAMGRIPGFTEHIFPSVSIPYLTLVADIGLCLFLFLIGLEIDISLIKCNARNSAIVCLAGIILPFGLGAALSVALYHQFIDPSVHIATFMLFTGVAYSITAFSTLCRILTELQLLDTSFGVVAISTGIGNDLVGWMLLALCVAIVNAGSGVSALWILLVSVSFAVFLLFPVRFVMLLLARKTGSTENGPTVFYTTVVLLLLWSCAFFTDSIGVNVFFGSFLAGLVVPREGGLAINLVEKLEDVVTIVFLPLYFTLSGLKTNFGLLNSGITWAFTIAIIALAFTGKFGGCMLAARATGYGWRESCIIGTLMSCKGLIEIITLNVGLEAGILSQSIFSMFVFAALVLMLMTMPLVTVFYSPELRVQDSKIARPPQDVECGQQDDKASVTHEEPTEHPRRYRFTVVLDGLDHVPSAMALTQLVLPPRDPMSNLRSSMATTGSESMDNLKAKMPRVRVEALQLVELSDRTSATMKSCVVTDNLMRMDPALGMYRMFGELNDIEVTSSLSVVPYDDFARTVSEHAQRHASQLILLPWVPHTAPTGLAVSGMSEAGSADCSTPKTSKIDHNPFDLFFGTGSKAEALPLATHSPFVRGVFSRSKTDVALFVDTDDRSETHIGGKPLHVFFPFFGGPDDRLALEFVVQLCFNPKITATVVRMVKRDAAAGAAEGTGRPTMGHLGEKMATGQAMLTPDVEGPSACSTMASVSVPGQMTTVVRLQSETADSIAWGKYVNLESNAHNDATSPVRLPLSRIQFSDVHTPTPLHAAILKARAIREMSSRLLIVTGRSRRLTRDSHDAEMKNLLETYLRSSAGLEGMRRTIGDVGTAMVVGGASNGVVVVQAAPIGRD